VVVIMDGVGMGRRDDTDAVFSARTPTLDALMASPLARTLRAHGTAVGLPSDDDMGNSEVGHNALGAGRVFDQGARLVNEALASGALFRGDVWRSIVERVRTRGSTLHFVGLLSDGNVHSHIAHLEALLAGAAHEGVRRARVHALLDGRDVPETSALTYVDRIERVLGALSTEGRDYRVASGGGRMKVTMDRYGADWPMVARGWALHVRGEGRGFHSTREAVVSLRDETPGVSDQNLTGFVIVDERGAPVGPVRDGDAVVLFNFRGDRAIELTRAFEDEVLTAFDRGVRPEVLFAGMMQYDGDLALPKRFLVNPPEIDRTVGEYLSRAGVRQLAISETQKFGHVTYFWNGNRSGTFDPALETYLEVASDVRPFEERPWMKAAEVTDALIAALTRGDLRHARVNYANGDMVGHTGAFESTVLAVEAVDLQLARLVPVVRSLRGALLVTADHGNADDMYEFDKKKNALALDAEGRRRPKTSHSLNPVPVAIDVPEAARLALRSDLAEAGIAHVAATTLHLMGYDAPEGYLPSLLAASSALAR
jgi:2,3-bisphosphoglycerate-independent phosphoglycerate mutase